MGKHDENGYWWCDGCEAEVTSIAVRWSPGGKKTYTCLLCGSELIWAGYCHACSVAGGADRAIYHAGLECSDSKPGGGAG
jgi:hypothetical protein